MQSDSINQLLKSITRSIGEAKNSLPEESTLLNLKGEYWIDANDKVIDASGGSHEEIAIDDMFPPGTEVRKWLQYFVRGDPTDPSRDTLNRYASEIEAIKEGINPSYYMIVEHGWIRNYDFGFDIDELTDKNLSRISDLLWNTYHVNPEEVGEKEIIIQTYKVEKTLHVKVEDIMNEPESIIRRAAFVEGEALPMFVEPPIEGKEKSFYDLIMEYIRKIGKNKWRVYSEKGKNMGTYGSREGAKKRLKDIEYFKHK